LAASADGTTLYTDLAGEDQEKPDVVAVDVHTGAVRTVVVNGRLPGLSPDGRTLVFKRGTPMRPDAGLHLLDLVTGTERTIVVDAGALPVHDRRQPKSDTNYFPPRFSPDGRWIASGALAHDGLGLLGIDAGASPRLLPVPNAIDGGVGFWGDEVLYGASDAATSWNAGAPNVAFRVRAEPSPVPGIGGRGAPTTLVGGPAGSAGEVGAAGRELFSAPITLIPGDTAFAVMDVVPATSSQRARLVVTVIASGSSSGSGIAYGWTEGQAPKRLAENVRAIVLAPSRTPATVRTRPGVGTGPSSTTTGSVSTLAPGGSSPATTGTRPATATTTGLVER
jgi:hypothetical protein